MPRARRIPLCACGNAACTKRIRALRRATFSERTQTGVLLLVWRGRAVREALRSALWAHRRTGARAILDERTVPRVRKMATPFSFCPPLTIGAAALCRCKQMSAAMRRWGASSRCSEGVACGPGRRPTGAARPRRGGRGSRARCAGYAAWAQCSRTGPRAGRHRPDAADPLGVGGRCAHNGTIWRTPLRSMVICSEPAGAVLS